MSLGAETLRYRVAATDDDFGNPTDAGDPVTFEGCAFYPRGAGSEDSGRALTVIDGYTALIDSQPGTDTITALGEIEWAREPGIWRGVVGNPGRWVFLDGDDAGIQVNVKGEAG